jgi:hypothetical protein
MGRKLLALVMVAVLTISFAGCGNGKKLVPVWVWDNVYDGLKGFLVNEDGSFMVKYGEDYKDKKIALYNSRKAWLHTGNLEFAKIVNGRFVSYNPEYRKSFIYDVSRALTNREVEGTLLDRQLDRKSLFFENPIRNPKEYFEIVDKKLIKTNLVGLELWSIDFKSNVDFYPVALDDKEQMTLLAVNSNVFSKFISTYFMDDFLEKNIKLINEERFWEYSTKNEFNNNLGINDG